MLGLLALRKELSEGQFQNKNMLTIPPINPPCSCSIIKDQDLRQRDKTSQIVKNISRCDAKYR